MAASERRHLDGGITTGRRHDGAASGLWRQDGAASGRQRQDGSVRTAASGVAGYGRVGLGLWGWGRGDGTVGMGAWGWGGGDGSVGMGAWGWERRNFGIMICLEELGQFFSIILNFFSPFILFSSSFTEKVH